MNLRLAKTALAVALFGVAGIAAAQDCPGTRSLDYTSPNAPGASGNTCTDGADVIALYCSGQDSVGKNEVVYKFKLAAAGPQGRSGTAISFGDSGSWTRGLYLFNDANCIVADSCVRTSSSSINLVGVADGNYYLSVTATPASAAGTCGPYNISANGSLPVSVQSFSVE